MNQIGTGTVPVRVINRKLWPLHTPKRLRYDHKLSPRSESSPSQTSKSGSDQHCQELTVIQYFCFYCTEKLNRFVMAPPGTSEGILSKTLGLIARVTSGFSNLRNHQQHRIRAHILLPPKYGIVLLLAVFFTGSCCTVGTCTHNDHFSL
jgi:hypothetical protein